MSSSGIVLTDHIDYAVCKASEWPEQRAEAGWEGRRGGRVAGNGGGGGHTLDDVECNEYNNWARRGWTGLDHEEIQLRTRTQRWARLLLSAPRSETERMGSVDRWNQVLHHMQLALLPQLFARAFCTLSRAVRVHGLASCIMQQRGGGGLENITHM